MTKIDAAWECILARPVKPVIQAKELYFDMNLGIDDGYFAATPEEVFVALDSINREMAITDTVPYCRFYEFLKIPVPKACMDKGWGLGAGVLYGYKWISTTENIVTLDDGLVVHQLTFVHKPTDDYLDYPVDI